MVSNIITVLSAVIGTVGFSLMLRLRYRRLPVIAVSTALTYSLYLLCVYLTFPDFMSTLCAAIFAAFISEMLAIHLHAPVTVFLLPTILPLVPGASLYYTIDATFRAEYHDALFYFGSTCRGIGAILLGIVIVNTVMKCIRNFNSTKHNHND